MSGVIGTVVDVAQAIVGPAKWLIKKTTGYGRTDIEEEAELRQQRRDQKFHRTWVTRQWKRLW